MAGPALTADPDATYPDDGNDASVQLHQQDHTRIHAVVKALNTDIATNTTPGAILEYDGTAGAYMAYWPGSYDEPNDLGFKAWSCDPRIVSGGSQPGAGIMYLQRLRYSAALASGAVVNHELYIQTAGVGSTALANCFVGLYRADTGALIGTSATQATAWATTGIKDVAITLTAAKPAGVDILAALLVGTQSTTPVQWGKSPGGLNAALTNGKGPAMFLSAGTGQTAPPATLPTQTAHSATFFSALF